MIDGLVRLLSIVLFVTGGSIMAGYAAYYAIRRWSPHQGEHLRFMRSDTPGVSLWYCTACGESGAVDDLARDAGGFLHGPECQPPE